MLLATPTTAQFASTTGGSNLIKLASPATRPTTLDCVEHLP